MLLISMISPEPNVFSYSPICWLSHSHQNPYDFWRGTLELTLFDNERLLERDIQRNSVVNEVFPPNGFLETVSFRCSPKITDLRSKPLGQGGVESTGPDFPIVLR